jgi:hypothetical protein
MQCIKKDLSTDVCDAIANMLEQSPTNRILEGLQSPQAGGLENGFLQNNGTDNLIEELGLHNRLDAALKQQDLNLREIRLKLDRLSTNREEETASNALFRTPRDDPYLKA